MEMIRAQNLTFYYPGSGKLALENASITIDPGDFAVICGPSGCGKTTLVRNLKCEIAPYGKLEGSISYKGQETASLPSSVSASEIGFVMQDPESQQVTDTVCHEMAFGLENLGVPPSVIRRRIAETAHFFGINEWFGRKVIELSGGQKQILNLAAVMAMQPQLIILDEPTAQLDPIASKEFLSILKRINQDLGTTVVLTEQRLEEVFPMADKVIYMENGHVCFTGSARGFIAYTAAHGSHFFMKALPAAARIAAGLGEKAGIPITVSEGRAWLKGYISRHDIRVPEIRHDDPDAGKTVLRANNIWFRYSPQDDFALRGFSCEIREGMITSFVGGNGSGKTTALCMLAGIYAPVRGNIRKANKEHRIAMLPQDPKTVFVHDTVWEDISETASLSGNGSGAAKMMAMLGIDHIRSSHPYDLSGGEQQRAAIAKLLMLDPDIILLDEPTKGLDVCAKEDLAKMLRECCASGKAVVMVTHDIEFAASCSDTCALIFNGEIICTDPAKRFFDGNTFYTTSANRVCRDIIPGAVTCEDAASIFGGVI